MHIYAGWLKAFLRFWSFNRWSSTKTSIICNTIHWCSFFIGIALGAYAFLCHRHMYNTNLNIASLFSTVFVNLMNICAQLGASRSPKTPSDTSPIIKWTLISVLWSGDEDNFARTSMFKRVKLIGGVLPAYQWTGVCLYTLDLIHNQRKTRHYYLRYR